MKIPRQIKQSLADDYTVVETPETSPVIKTRRTKDSTSNNGRATPVRQSAAVTPKNDNKDASHSTPLFLFLNSPEQIPESLWAEMPGPHERCPFTGMTREGIEFFRDEIQTIPPGTGGTPRRPMYNLRSFLRQYWQ